MTTSLLSETFRNANKRAPQGQDIHAHCKAIIEGTLALNQGRRQAVRNQQLRVQGREEPVPMTAENLSAAREGWTRALVALRSITELVPDWLLRSLDDTLAQQIDPNSDISQSIQQLGISLGFNSQEVAWLRNETERLGFRVVSALTAQGKVSLRDVVAGALSGEHDLLHCGFLGLTRNTATNTAVTLTIQTCREQGATASLFFLLPVISAASMLTAENPEDSAVHPLVKAAFAA